MGRASKNSLATNITGMPCVASSALATSWVMLALAQAIAGLAGGVMLPAIYTVATTTGSQEEGSRMLGRVLAGWSVSLIAGVPLSALIAERFGWQASFLSLSALVATSLVGFWAMPRLDNDTRPQKARNPFAVLALPGIVPLLLVQFLFMTAFYGTYAFFGDHLRTSLGLSAGMAGLVVLFYGIGFGIAATADGIVDRVGPVKALPYAMTFVAIAYGIMPFMATSLIGALVAASLWGFANHFVLNVIVLRLSRIGGTQRGAVLGLNSAITYFGALVGALGELYANLGFSGLAWGGATCVCLALGVIIAQGRDAQA